MICRRLRRFSSRDGDPPPRFTQPGRLLGKAGRRPPLPEERAGTPATLFPGGSIFQREHPGRPSPLLLSAGSRRLQRGRSPGGASPAEAGTPKAGGRFREEVLLLLLLPLPAGSCGGGWMAAAPASSELLPPLPAGTPLASARAWVPRPSSSGREGQRLLRLQLSAAPGQERFRLGLRGGPDAGPERSLVEYSLQEISYEVKTPTCHELKVLARPDDPPLVFHFEDEHEAQKWWAVVSSSLWEVQKARLPPLHPLATVNSLPVSDLEASLPSKLAQKEALALRLSAAIELGDEEEATRCAMALAQQQATLRILLKESCYPTSEISMKVGVEDATCSATITIQVHTYTTVATLKQQVFQDYGFHPSVQRWIIGQCLCVDDRTVGSYGIRKDGDMAFLYLLSARGANLSEQRYKEDRDWMVLQPAPSLRSESSSSVRKPSTLPHPLPKKGLKDASRQMDGGEEISCRLGALQLSSLLPSQPPAQPAAAAAAAPLSPGLQAGWPCPTCTFINKPTRPGCEMCSTDRPAHYVVPGGYRPDERELLRMQQEKEGILQYQQEKGRREDGSAVPRTHSLGSLDDFIHLSMEFS